MLLLKKTIAPLTLLLALTVSGQGFAASAIRDEAGLFSENAKARATETANSITKDTGRNVTVETMATLPAGTPAQDPELDHWVDQRAANEGVKGVYVFIVKSPGKVYVAEDSATRVALPKADSVRVREVIVASFKNKQFDEGLLAGLDEMRIRMLANKPQGASSDWGRSASNSPVGVPAHRSAPGDSGFSMWMCVGALALIAIGFFFIKRVLGGSQRGYGPTTGGPPPLPGQQGYNPNYQGGMPAQGGGFGRGAMGGLLGGFGGAWLYDRLFNSGGGGGAGNTAWGASPPSASSDAYNSNVGEGTDFQSSGGGSFGDSSDFSSGGGDFDSGGGGGDFGGGGDSGGGGDF